MTDTAQMASTQPPSASTAVEPPGTTVGKRVAGQRYLHVSALATMSAAVQDAVARARTRLDGDARRFDVLRLDERDGTIGFLHYPAFWDAACPALVEAVQVHPERGVQSRRSYADSRNPPILHRKELLLAPDHPCRPAWQALTASLEALGLFDAPHLIGFAQTWAALLDQAGYRLIGHELIPLGNATGNGADSVQTGQAADPGTPVMRHRTALARTGFSAPIQLLHRHGYLDRGWPVFDYGCGRGDDVRGLAELGIAATGWDPYYRTDGVRVEAPIVNLGFVLNVIEDPLERLDTLRAAFALATRLLVVAVMPVTQQSAAFAPYRDGVLTARQTFQRYFTQAELADLVEHALAVRPTMVAPGICFVFRHDDDRDDFERVRLRGQLRPPRLAALPRTDRPAARRDPDPDRSRAPRARATLTDAQRHALDGYWQAALERGRWPLPDEVPGLDAALGPTRRAQRWCLARPDAARLAQAAAQRREDTLVYLALEASRGRQRQRGYPPGPKADLDAHFDSVGQALHEAQALVRRLPDVEALQAAARAAVEQGLGHLDDAAALTVATELVPRLPALLRLYVAIGATLFGDVAQADLVKLHTRSAKLSLMEYDEFTGRALPRLQRRTKLDFRRRVVDVFEYGTPHEPPYLYRKSRYLNEESAGYAEQLAFDDALAALPFVDLSGHGPSASAFDAMLARHHYVVDGRTLRRQAVVPALDAPCGRYLRYRQLIECGATQAATGLANLPLNPDSYVALFDLATRILDPVIEYFGMIELTYGFCSAALAREVPGRNDPALDQHAAHERNRLGKPICARGGAAVDFLVRDEDMGDVADWIIAHLPFDRLYFYGPDRPLHVSFGPAHSRQAVRMRRTAAGRLVPARY